MHMRRIILIAAIGLLALQAAAREPWQNGFSVGVEGNFALYDDSDPFHNDFEGVSVKGNYHVCLGKGFFVRPELSFYYRNYSRIRGIGNTNTVHGPSDKDNHASETGIGIAAFGGYRVPAGKICSIDFFTGPYYGIAINQHKTDQGYHFFDLRNKSSLRWRFGLGVNVWRLTVGASFDLSMLKIGNTPWAQNERESNVVSVGIGYNF